MPTYARLRQGVQYTEHSCFRVVATASHPELAPDIMVWIGGLRKKVNDMSPNEPGAEALAGFVPGIPWTRTQRESILHYANASTPSTCEPCETGTFMASASHTNMECQPHPICSLNHQLTFTGPNTTQQLSLIHI